MRVRSTFTRATSRVASGSIRELVDRTVTAVRDACGVPVGVSTGAWIEPDLERRIELIRAWTAPDYASVNLSEEGARDVARALVDARVGIEAAVWTVGEARQLAEWDTHAGITRVLVEPVDLKAAEAVAFVDAIHDVLDRAGVGAPRLQHGDGDGDLDPDRGRGPPRARHAHRSRGHPPRPRRIGHRG